MNQDLSFKKYIDDYRHLLIKIANVYCHNKEERKDLIQEIILQLWKSYTNYNSSYKLSTWTYRIALNVSISYVRKTIVRNKALQQYKENIVLNIEDSIGENENAKRLYNALEVLKPIERAIVTLHLEACSNKEIAEVIGISPSNVSTRLLRIKDKLKTKLTK